MFPSIILTAGLVIGLDIFMGLIGQTNMEPQQITSIQLFFLQKVVRQNNTDVTSLSMQLEKEGRGLLREVFCGEELSVR